MIEFTYILTVIFIGALCWGSFLNVVAYRLIHNKSFLTSRSYCPHCTTTLAWYDLIPLLSWCLLAGRCRYCKQSISPVYPLLEIATATCFTLYTYITVFQHTSFHTFIWAIIPYNPLLTAHLLVMFCFFSALLVNTATDLYTLSILQLFTLGPIPIIFAASWYGIMPLSLTKSILGCVVGYGILWATARSFKLLKGYDGMGEGDFEILALIGSVIGVLGIFKTLFVASCAGTLCGILYIIILKKEAKTAIPFGPFLVFGALWYIFSVPTGL